MENGMHKLVSIIDRAEALMDNLIDGRMILCDSSLSRNLRMNDNCPAHLELEARLGDWNSFEKRFHPGVKRFFMERALNMLDSFDAWSRVTGWVEMQDLFYKDAFGHDMRTTVYYDDASQQIRKQHIIKQVLDRETAIVQGSENPDIRLSLAVEHEVDETHVPEVVQPEYVRLKQRKSYFYTPLKFSEPIFVFDMTLSWSGATKSEAEQKQYNEAPVYEIECECLSPMAYRLHKQESKEFVARSLLLKLLDFYYPPTDPPSTPNAETLFDTLTIAH